MICAVQHVSAFSIETVGETFHNSHAVAIGIWPNRFNIECECRHAVERSQTFLIKGNHWSKIALAQPAIEEIPNTPFPRLPGLGYTPLMLQESLFVRH